MAPWYHGTMAPWHHGTMAPWYHGTRGSSFLGPGHHTTTSVIGLVEEGYHTTLWHSLDNAKAVLRRSCTKVPAPNAARILAAAATLQNGAAEEPAA